MDITLDTSVSMLNTQAIEQALELGVKRVTFSVEDTIENIRTMTASTNQAALVLYQDVPLFLSANCVRDNDCQACDHKRWETDLKSGRGQYRLISDRCQTVVIDSHPFALPPIAQDLPVQAFRIDFCYRHYTAEQAVKIINQVRNRQPIPGTTAGHFEKQFAD